MKDNTEELEKFRKNASEESLGLSSEDILEDIISYVKHSKSLLSLQTVNIFDVGCGTGDLLCEFKKHLKNATLTGCDYTDFKTLSDPSINFFQHDCNKDLPLETPEFDLVTSSEVIEHIENPRHFVRQLSSKLKKGGILIISTPNLESITSLLSFSLRGYHSAFGGKAYPAHITAVGAYDLTNMINETNQLKVLETHFVQNGRMPGMNVRWSSLFPFLKSKRFSDNYFIVAQKI
jgi:2-polyprenyl-3-methyl-5-hydroxy-6-metoxy-1,4-benzoquinol methylase